MQSLLRTLAALAFSVTTATAVAGIDATEITEKLRAEYSGEYLTETGGVVRSAVLSDGKIVIETEGDLAKYLLYNLPKAPDVVEYRPPVAPAIYVNYFVREGVDIVCGFMSQDLKRDPLPQFKCRFAVDAHGVVQAFADRKSEYESGPNEFDQASLKFTDFFFQKLSQQTTDAGASNFSRFWTPEVSFNFQFQGLAARDLYEALSGVEQFDEYMGPIKNQVRVGKSIYCLQFGKMNGSAPNPDRDYKCMVQFGFDGKASHGHQPQPQMNP